MSRMNYLTWMDLGFGIRRMSWSESPLLLGKVAHGFSTLGMWSMAERHAKSQKEGSKASDHHRAQSPLIYVLQVISHKNVSYYKVNL